MYGSIDQGIETDGIDLSHDTFGVLEDAGLGLVGEDVLIDTAEFHTMRDVLGGLFQGQLLEAVGDADSAFE